MTMPADAPAWLRDILTELGRAQALAGQQLATLAMAQARSEERFAAVEAQLARLAAAQERSEGRLDRLAAAQEATATLLGALAASTERRFAAIEAQLAQHGERLDRIDALLARHDERLDRIEAQLGDLAQHMALLAAAQQRSEQRLDRHGDQLGRLEGWAWETRVRDRAASYLADVADRVQVLTPPERDRLLDPAVRDGRLSRTEARAVRLADFIASGVDPESDAPRLLVAEISPRVDAHDVERAAARAALLGRLGTPALGVVVGQRIDHEAQIAADASGVRLIQAGA